MQKTIVFPLPDRDFDVTEVAVPWKLLTRSGYRVVFATEDGKTPAADPRLLRGVIFGQLGAAPEPLAFYRELEADKAFCSPARWRDLVEDDYAGLFLAGGHAPGMKQYLASAELAQFVGRFWARRRPVAAICHGVVVLARTRDLASETSVLYASRTTCLPKYMEQTAYFLTAWKLGRYYRTYPTYVEDEVRSALRSSAQFVRGPRTLLAKGTDVSDAGAFVVVDGHYVSGRWPGDAYRVAKSFLTLLEESRVTPAGGPVATAT